MDDFEQKRKLMEQTYQVKGYSHPDVCNPYKPHNLLSPYQSYSKTGKDPYVSHSSETYMSGNSFSALAEENEFDYDVFCPLCSGSVSYTCDCPIEDKKCERGHTWYINEKGKPVVKDPHK
jgi:hypothetical protein